MREGGVDVGGGWFKDCIFKQVGNMRDILFWIDPWVEGDLLSVRFRHLYDLSVSKNCTVEEMFELGVEEGGLAWNWRRRLWDWEEEMARECRLLLSNVVLQVSTNDRWCWRLDINGGYSVRSVYHMLNSDDSQVVDVVSDFIWHRHVTVKVSILAWRLLRNRLPTKSNLVARGILLQEAQMCVACCGEVETAHRLFVSCTVFCELWHLVREWIGVSGVDPFDIATHFHQFTYLAGGSINIRSFMQLLWLMCVWIRNNRLFKNEVKSMYQLLEKVKIHAYWWMKAANAMYVLGVHSWLTCPIACLGTGYFELC